MLLSTMPIAAAILLDPPYWLSVEKEKSSLAKMPVDWSKRTSVEVLKEPEMLVSVFVTLNMLTILSWPAIVSEIVLLNLLEEVGFRGSPACRFLAVTGELSGTCCEKMSGIVMLEDP